MAYLDPNEAFDHFRDRTLEAIGKQFPVDGINQVLSLERLEVPDELSPDDIRSQHHAKVNGQTWGVPIIAHLALTNKQTGEVTRSRTRIAELPKVTGRHSHIVNGQEYQVDNQWQLKPGAYVRRRQTGQIETMFQSSKRPSFDVTFDDASKEFKAELPGGKAIVPLYPLLSALGVHDDELERAWGKDILQTNKSSRNVAGAVAQYYKTTKRAEPKSHEDAARHLVDSLKQTDLRPESTDITLGKPIDHVNGDALLRATKRMLAVQRGEAQDDRDSLVFKDLRSVGDFSHDKIMAASGDIRRKMQRKINTATSPRDVVPFEAFNKPIRETFFKNSAAQVAKQINPVEMVSTAQQTTVMGPGGIQSEQQILDEVKFVNASHMGFLDPIHTPEGCFDAATEVFTSSGWLPWPHVDATTVFACLIGDRLEFHLAEELQAYDYTGCLYGLRKPGLEYLVTPNHRMLCRPLDAGSQYRVVRADEMHDKVRAFKAGHGAFVGESQLKYRLPQVAGNNSSKNVAEVDLADWAELVGWYLSEGSCTYVEATSSYQVKIFQSEVNADCCRQIERLLGRLPFAWSTTIRDHGRNAYVLATKQLAFYFSQLGVGSPSKHFLEEMHTWPLVARERLFEALMLGDGRLSHLHKNPKQRAYVYTTTSLPLAKDVERLIISLGWGASVKRYTDLREDRYLDIFEVRLLIHKEVTSQPSSRNRATSPYYKVEYTGKVYCATVPGSYLYVRRNNKRPLWLGNSKTGVTLRMPISVTQHGHEPRIPLYNMRTGKTEQVGPATFLRSKVVLPDQVTWDGDKPVAKYPAVKWSTTGNEVADGHLKDADYVMKHSSQFFNITSNLIPFVNNTSGGRASMATRHMEQSISLLHREAPMVQVGTGSSTAGSRTFEEIIGSQASHRSPVSGTVKAVKHDAVVVTDHLGKDHEVQVYRNYPLNDAKSVLDSTILVKPGDKVKASQVVADTNFSRNGTIALGTNLRVGYIPYKGYNFEDGVVISESAAKKLSSVHLYKHKVGVDDDTVLAKRHYMTQHPGLYGRDQFSKIGDNGLAVVGSKVQPGDPLVLSMKKAVVKDRTGLSAIRKSLGETYSDRSLTWEGEGPGEVVSSFKKDGEVVVHVRAVEPMQVGDKMAGRYGNKGIVTKIVPDHEMPHTPDGRHIEVALNPSGVPGRMNIGQVLETAASKIAEKTGKPYAVQNFDGTNQLETIQAELKKHGISDVEDLYDPMNKQKLGSALVGNQHMIKLHHQVDKKVSVRSGLNLPGGGVEKYNSNLQPTGGGHSGGQSMDPLGLYSLLAHGARANIREMQTWKSEGPDMSASAAKQWQSQHHDVWDAIQHGDPLPTPKPTFAFKKFTDMLTGAGINIEKHGHEFVLTPLTNQQIHALTGDRVLPKPAELLYAKPDPKTGEPRPKPGGLFDERLTGGHGGKKWSRMTLAEPVPNPVFAESIRMLTGLSNEHYTGLVHGTHVLGADGKVVPMGPGITGQAGGAAVETLLHKVDIDKDLAAARKALDTLPASKVDKTLKKVKRLQALKDAGLGAAEAYILHSLPIVPPAMRPITVMHDGSFKFDDINQLYSQLAQNNSQLQDPTLRDNLLPERRRDLRRDLYDGVGAVMGVGVPYADAAHKGLIHQIQGAAPKTGYFQSTLISRKQDLSMRSTIVPEPALSLDEIGLPKEHAMKLFSPFVVGELRKSGMALNVADAQSMVAKNAPAAQRALQRVMTDRPVLLKRDPALHKYSVQAFKPRVVDGNAIKIHPLVTGGYNADFDGDTMSVFVPIGQDAVAEAHKMLPSNNLFSEATGKVMYQPTLESALGLYKLSRVTDAKVHHVQHPADAIKLVQTGKLSVNDRVQYGGQVTTTGRILMAAALPEPMQQSILGDLHKSLDKKGLDTLLTQVAREHSGNYGSVADKLKDIGNGAASGVVTVEHNNYTGDHRLDPQKRTYVPVGVHTLALSDFTPDIATREHVLAPVRVEVAKIKGSSMTQYAKDAATVRAWSAADQQMQKDHMAKATDKPSNLMTMHLAGVKPGWGQYKQLTLAPMLVADASGRTIPVPITKSYAEGLDTGDYWNQMHGARRGAVMKVQEVREPGYLSKLLMANTMDMVVNGEDCGTTRGIALPVTDSDVHDRILQKDFSVKGVHIPAGTTLTPNLVSRMRAVSPREQIVVRSPLKCEHAKGVCQKCMGLSSDGNMHQIGENIGVSAAQSLGERAVQLTMRVFHTGGTVDTGGGSKVLGEFDRLNQLMMLPKHIADSSTLAMHTGTIEKIEPTATGVTVYISGKKHHVGKDAKGAPLWKPLVDAAPGWAPPKVGMQVTKGQVLSDPLRTLVNPHDLYKATGNMETVQNYLADQVHALYKGEGIKRKHVETVVKAMSNLTKIEAAGDYPGVLRGEFHPTSKIAALNRELIRSGKTPIEHKPVLKGVDIMPLSVQEDWMAKMQHIRLSKTLLDAAATGGTSNIHSLHPIPGMAYGAEFGLNQEHAKKRLALSHLHDVKGHEY